MAYDDSDDLPNPYQAPSAKMERPMQPGFGSSTPGIDLRTENPWLTIWTRPRATIRGIVDYAPTYRTVPIAMMTGIIQVVNRMMEKNTGDTTSIAGMLKIAAIMGPLAGIAQLYIAGWWFSNMGRIFGGHAPSKEVRTVAAWSSVPNLFTIPFLVLAIAVLGKGMFREDVPDSDDLVPLIAIMSLGTAQVILGIWSGVVFLKGLGEVHGFSAWKALACVIVPALLLLLLLGIIVGIFMIASR